MTSITGINDGGSIKLVRRDVSKLVAIPKILLKSQPSPAVRSSSTSPLTNGSNSTLRSDLASDTPFTMQAISKSNDVRNPGDSMTVRVDKESISKQVQWEYDVYAKAFVPSVLRALNTEEAHVILTQSKHSIDFQKYVHTFVGTDFLPTRPLNHPETDSILAVPSKAPLDAQSYFQFFTALMDIECKAKKQEQEGFALYKVPLQCALGPEGDLWALSVPGLREDNPHLEMADTLHLRQLWIDTSGKLMHIPLSVGSSQVNRVGSYTVTSKCWTGVQYDASICSVNRAQEIVYLKVEGLQFLSTGWNSLPMEVNVSFPLKGNLVEAKWKALVSISMQLRGTICAEHQQDPVTLERRRETPKKLSSINDNTLSAPEKLRQKRSNGWVRRMLFPTEEDGRLQTSLRKIPHRSFFDHAINYEQAHAVNDVCNNGFGTLPYLISGPPGTGKTKTLVETAMQLLHTTDITHILICAPSEAAADTLTVRLKQYLNIKQLFRLNRPGRADNEVVKEITQYCYIENDMFYLPPFKTLMAFNVVVTSCRDATILTEARLTNNDLWTLEQNMFSAFHPEEQVPVVSLHWGALLIDEAAQAVEMDILPAMNVVYPPSIYPAHQQQPRFVMAGDENQLGPRTASHDPDYSTSLFARLFNRPLYKNHPLSRSNIGPTSNPPVLKSTMLPITYPPFTLLFRNYRSHPAILSIPSSLFYNDTLIPEAVTSSTPLQRFPLWRGRGKWPLLFFPNNGFDELERDGGGWYNISEAHIACDIAQRLIIDGKVQQSDICIMSPFAAQVKVLRSLIRSNQYGSGSGLWYVNIGPLEAFQGLESRAVIICTTRTRERFLDRDEKAGFGIIHQKRKMNVALTRAKEALFVIGSPAVLRQDEHWREWLAFCRRNGLVVDEREVWKDEDQNEDSPRIGVLERALIARDIRSRNADRPALGAGAAGHDISGNSEYEGWIESLREALDEEDEEDEQD